MLPEFLAGLCVKAMQEAAEIRIIEQSVVNRRGRDRAANLVEMPDQAVLGQVAALGRIDAIGMAAEAVDISQCQCRSGYDRPWRRDRDESVRGALGVLSSSVMASPFSEI